MPPGTLVSYRIDVDRSLTSGRLHKSMAGGVARLLLRLSGDPAQRRRAAELGHRRRCAEPRRQGNRFRSRRAVGGFNLCSSPKR